MAIAGASKSMQAAAELLSFLGDEMGGTVAADSALLRDAAAAGTGVSAAARDVLDLVSESLDWPEVLPLVRCRPYNILGTDS